MDSGESSTESAAPTEADEDKNIIIATATAAVMAQDPVSAALAATSIQQSPSETGETGPSAIGPVLTAIYAQCQTWHWKGMAINYVKQGNGSGPAVLLVHGFGASIGHFRKNIPVLAESNTVFAIDLLGQGASAKPAKFQYTIETWAELLLDFMREIIGGPTILLGNSIGSLAALLACAEAPQGAVAGLVLLNCAGGMNNKAISDDWRIKLALPIFWTIDWLLLQPRIAKTLFNRFRSNANVQTVLQSVYSNKGAVDAELVELIIRPADDVGALDAFVSIITGPPGPRPESLVPKINHPILILWGDEDPFTPFDGPIGKYFRNLPNVIPSVSFVELSGVGHCPHDDRPDLVHASLVPWIAGL